VSVLAEQFWNAPLVYLWWKWMIT